jgi:hypothetical protein
MSTGVRMLPTLLATVLILDGTLVDVLPQDESKIVTLIPQVKGIQQMTRTRTQNFSQRSRTSFSSITQNFKIENVR